MIVISNFREAIEKEQARLRYQKLQAEGKTDEARADLARLAIIRKQREESAKKKEEEKQGIILTFFFCHASSSSGVNCMHYFASLCMTQPGIEPRYIKRAFYDGATNAVICVFFVCHVCYFPA